MRRSWGLLRRSILAFRRVSGVDRGLNVGSGFAPPPTAKGDWRAVEVKVEWGRRCLTTSADTKVKDQADASSLKRHVPVKVGADLQICTDTDVDVVTGQSLEEIVLEAKWKAGDRAGDWSEFQLIESAHHVKLGYGGGAALEGIRASMPARWCSLSVEAKQNPVRIQSLKEGTLNVETSGGHVTLGDMRGGWAKILTNGGCFTADVVSADSAIKTSGGDVSIKRLVGTTIDVDTNGGDIHIGSLYGNDVVMKTAGGSFEAKHIQAQDSALVSTEGGSVQITGIDGKASIVTSGGAVSLQLHEHAREIDIDASVGAVTLYFSNNLCAQVEYNGNGRAIDQASQILRATREPGHYSFIGSESWRGMQGDFSRASRSEEASQANKQQPQVCHIRIVSAGSLHVKMRSWIDVAMQSGLPSFVK